MSDTNIMNAEEEAQLEALARQRRGGRTLAMYGGPPPDLSAPSTCLPGYRTTGLSEPDSSKTNLARQILQHSTRLRIGFADTVGRRPTMEDEIVICGQLRNVDEDFVAVYDGHSGNESSVYASKHLHNILIEKLNEYEDPKRSLIEAFIETNDRMKKENIGGGSTAIVAFFTKNKCYIANAGDSRAVISEDSKAIRCSTDHKPDHPDEEARITNSGGVVIKIPGKLGKTIARVNGQLAVSRALGDHAFKPHVTAEPQITEIEITQKNKILVLACDGLWDILEDQETIDLISSEEDPSRAATKLRDCAFNRGSGDNISVVVINIPATFSSASQTQPVKQEMGQKEVNKEPLLHIPWKAMLPIVPIILVGIFVQHYWSSFTKPS